jgi:hypothetical protein
LKVINTSLYRFTSKSANNADYFYTQLRKCEFEGIPLLGLPWMIFVEMCQDGGKKFPLWKLVRGEHRNPDLVAYKKAAIPVSNGNQKMIGTGEKINNPFTDKVKEKPKLEEKIKVEDIIGDDNKITNNEVLGLSKTVKIKQTESAKEEPEELVIPAGDNGLLNVTIKSFILGKISALKEINDEMKYYNFMNEITGSYPFCTLMNNAQREFLQKQINAIGREKNF